MTWLKPEGSSLFVQRPTPPPECEGEPHEYGSTTCTECKRWMCGACKVVVGIAGPFHTDGSVVCVECRTGRYDHMISALKYAYDNAPDVVVNARGSDSDGDT